MDNQKTIMLRLVIAVALVVALVAGCSTNSKTSMVESSDKPTSQLSSQPTSQPDSETDSEPSSEPTDQADDQQENTYETPIRCYLEYDIIRKMKSAKELYQQAPKLINGFAEDAYSEIVNIMMTSDYFDALEEELHGNYWEQIYGEDWKYSYSIESKERINEEMLEDCKERYRAYGEEMIEWAEGVYDRDGGIEELSEGLGLTNVQAKKYLKASISFGNILKSARVTEGYKVTGRYIFEGGKLTEPHEISKTWYVCKVDGRWILAEMPLGLPLTYGNILGL